MDASHLGEFGKHPDDDDNDDGDGVHHETSTICYKDSTNESDLWANMNMIVFTWKFCESNFLLSDFRPTLKVSTRKSKKWRIFRFSCFYLFS